MNQRDTTKEGSSLWSVDAIESIDFIQQANIEAFKNTVIGMVGNTYDPTKVYVMWGCVNTGTHPAFDISAGAVFYNNEIFTVDAASNATPSGVPVGTLTTTYGTPILFSDGTTKQILQIRKFVIADGASGSGTSGTSSDYANFIPLVIRWQNYLSSTGLVSRTGGLVTHNVFSYTTPADGITRNYRVTFKLQYQCGISNTLGIFVGANITTGSPTGTIIGTTSSFAVPLIRTNFVGTLSTLAFYSNGYCVYQGSLAPGTTVYFNTIITPNGDDATYDDLLATVEQII